jgi:hypothetical protein
MELRQELEEWMGEMELLELVVEELLQEIQEVEVVLLPQEGLC